MHRRFGEAAEVPRKKQFRFYYDQLLTTDTDRLADLRKSPRQRMTKSPLMNAPANLKNFEAALRKMWKNWRSQAGACR